MRLLMLDNEFPPLGGGMGTINLELLRRLAGVPDLEIDQITSALGRQAEQEQFADRICLYKVPVDNRNIHHSSNRELLTYAARALPLALRLHRTQPYDHCLAWSAVPAGVIALGLWRMAGLRYSVRTTGPDIPGFEQRYRPLYPLLTPAIRAVWHGAQTTIVKCQAEADMITAVDPGVALTFIPNAVDLDRFPAAGPVAGNGPLRLICVARLIERKGQAHLIEAVRRLTDQHVPVTLDLVGTGDSAQEYQILVQRLGLADRVRFCGYLPREQIPQRLAEADVFVLPSYNEGMSVSTLEAMAAGLALVVTRTGGTDQLVEEGVNGLTFAWADVDLLVEHLRRLAADRLQTRQMGQASQKKAHAFSWERVAEQYVRLFDTFSPAQAVLAASSQS